MSISDFTQNSGYCPFELKKSLADLAQFDKAATHAIRNSPVRDTVSAVEAAMIRLQTRASQGAGAASKL